MADTARELVERITAELAPAKDANRLVPRIADGSATIHTLGALALEQRHVIGSDLCAFGFLAERSADAGNPACAEFFASLAAGERIALERLGAYESACGLDADSVARYEPLAGCQAYPAQVAWLALNGEPPSVALALTANFAAWGGYCATVAEALRVRYGFSEEACGFFDFFAEPAPDLERQALAAVASGVRSGAEAVPARRYGRLLQTYEAMFWNTLADR
ncbi:transcriptional regulator [Streptomyces sp. NPDC051597]|uniref:transcriptional regulator n=1 Tax=Streptomyces sp. NPDC051597 TaxID=3155049 RepID=UPI00344567F6